MKKILLTGANGDIGFAICTRLVQDGFFVICLNHHAFSLQQKKKLPKNNYAELLVNLENVAEIHATMGKIAKLYPLIFGLINNSGVYPIVPIEKYSLALWERVISINLTAPFLLTQLVAPLMKSGGKIINISSTGAHLGSRDAAYSASKAGLIGLTKSTARSLAKYNITVNAIAPGMIVDKMSRHMTRESIQKNREASLVNRFGVPTDVSGVVSFLLSSDADYLTGVTLDVNGGMYIR